MAVSSNFFQNPGAVPPGPYDVSLHTVFNREGARQAQAVIGDWQGYQPTPLRSLDRLAAQLQIAGVLYKDEAGRFGLGSFKALGGAYAVYRLLADRVCDQLGQVVPFQDLLTDQYQAISRRFTVASATAGNHGRAVAWGAQMLGCRCMIYVHAGVSAARAAAIAQYGATIVRVKGNYDDSVERAAADARANGWTVVSDTSYPGYTDIPKYVMQGYTVMVEEIVSALANKPRPTHMFLQGGVGGMAAAVCAYLWDSWGRHKPRCVIVEPEHAACLLHSARRGRLSAVRALDTVMSGLACGVPSLLAWQILAPGAEFYMSIPDRPALDAVAALARGDYGAGCVVAGESATAGLAGLIAAAGDSEIRNQLGLNADSRVLLIGTEGDTGSERHRQLAADEKKPLGSAS